MSVGEQLRRAREARKLSMADVTAAIKIQPWVLQALESDALQKQLSPVYARGFLTSYARFLQLPMDQLKAPAGVAAELAAAATAVETPAAQPVPSQEIPSVVRIPWKLPVIHIPRFRFPNIAWDVFGQVLRRAAPVIAVVAVVLINPFRWLPKITLPSAVPPRAASAAKPAPPAKKMAAKPQKPIKLASMVAAAKPAVMPTAPAAAPSPGPLELVVTANKATWIKVTADGKLLTQQRLERGAKEKWVGRKSLEVVVAKPSQVDLALNGQSINTAAIQNDGRLAISHQGVAKLAEQAR